MYCIRTILLGSPTGFRITCKITNCLMIIFLGGNMAEPIEGFVKSVESIPPWAGGVIMAPVVSVLRGLDPHYWFRGGGSRIG